MDAGFRGGDGAIADAGPVGHPHLARQNHPVAQNRTAGDSHLGRQGTAAAQLYTMAHMHQVVDLAALPKAGLPHGGPIDHRAAAHLHCVFQHDPAGLGHLAPAAGGGHKTKTLRTNHRSGVDDTTAPEAATRVQHRIGMDLTILT